MHRTETNYILMAKISKQITFDNVCLHLKNSLYLRKITFSLRITIRNFVEILLKN